MSPRIRELFKKLVLLFVTLLVTLLVAEVGVRILFPGWAPRTGRLVELWQYDREYGWAHVPSSSGRFASFGFDTFVEINSQGFRGPEVPTRKDPSQRRIVVIGDSFVWGFGVEYDEIFASRIENACRNVEVINLGVSGYSTDQELLLFEEKGADLEPDVVILVVAANDFSSNTRSKEYVYYHKPLFVIDGDELVLTNRPVPREGPLVRFAARTSKRSYLLTQINRVIHAARKEAKVAPEAPQVSEVRANEIDYPRTPAERVTGKLLERLLSSIEASGAKPVVVFVDGMQGRDRRLASYLGETGAELVHIDDYMPSGNHETHHLPGDFHWNPTGHAVVGNAVLDTMIESGVLPREACTTPF
jgi:lysophospholipase L1-like esterase